MKEFLRDYDEWEKEPEEKSLEDNNISFYEGFDQFCEKEDISEADEDIFYGAAFEEFNREWQGEEDSIEEVLSLEEEAKDESPDYKKMPLAERVVILPKPTEDVMEELRMYEKRMGYSDIFDDDETDADEEAKMRVISALKGLAEENDLENYLNTEEIIRYFVAHNFVLNYDSYTGNMLHNYYLYENDGKLSMLPWDYNLAFGGFSGNGGESGGSEATSLVITGIDTPLSGVTEEARPMWKKIRLHFILLTSLQLHIRR